MPRIHKLPGNQMLMNRLNGRYAQMPEYHPNRADYERWLDAVEEEAARRRYLENAMRIEYANERGYAPWGARTPKEYYRDPYSDRLMRYPETRDEFFKRYENQIPRGEEWYEAALFENPNTPYGMRFLPEEQELLSQEAYGDYEGLLNDLKNLRKQWGRRPLPEIPYRYR